MKFHIVSNTAVALNEKEPIGLLIHDTGWNDWFKYRTLYTLYIRFDGAVHSIGSLKIGQKGLTPEKSTPELDKSFDRLDDIFFTLGTNEDYYENSVKFSEKLGISLLQDLRDCARSLDIFKKYRSEDVMGESLLRSVTSSQVEGRFHRLATGNATPTEFSFAHLLPGAADVASIDEVSGEDGAVSFGVQPSSVPPSNIHVLIGRNGVGKTTRLTGIVHSLLGLRMPGGSEAGKIIFFKEDEWTGEKTATSSPDFANLVSVAFSAFDPFVPPTQDQIASSKISYAYIGLKRSSEEQKKGNLPETFSRADLAIQFADSAYACRSGLRAERWAQALTTLEADPLFAETNVKSLLTGVDEPEWRGNAAAFFNRLSSGHGIVLLTITRLVELVDERTLVLLDEPEGHLHPPLLSAFIRALSNLLARRNGVAIIATHSPVVLQEVPKSCVWYMSRSITSTWAERPIRETFAENVGVLTRDVFGLEVNNTGFHQLIREAVAADPGNFENVLKQFDGQLGEEGMALARVMSISAKKSQSKEG